jgi:hypothetical protein
MKERKNILLTFDHELFLGERSGDVNSCMVEPTKLLQDIFNDFKIEKAIFFLDTTYVSCLERNLDIKQVKKDYELVKLNIKFLLENGHYVFPHIHPHWLDATYVNNNWVLSNLTRYTFKACAKEERADIWEDSMRILNEFGVPDFHPIDSFRAGGWSIQPFEDYKPFFIKHGIQNDFTVLPGTFSHTDAQQYDFTAAPRLPIYNFEDMVTEPKKNGSFYQFPISTKTNAGSDSLSSRVFKKFLWKTNNRSIGKGQGVLPKNKPFQPKLQAKQLEMVSIELMHKLNLKDYKKHLDENEVVQFISHPKMLSRHNLKMFRKFMNYASQNYNLVFDFKSLK